MTNPTLDDLVTALRQAPLLPGGTRIGLIDGPAGSGKTTLAKRMAKALGGRGSDGAGRYDPHAPLAETEPVQTLHGDDMYEGWSGLDTLDDVLVDQILAPLSRGRAGRFRMWDWHQSRRTHTIEIPPRPFVLIEGVGVGRRAARELASMLIWIEAPDDIRLTRGLERDGEAMRDEWLAWMESEAAHFQAEQTRDRADVRLDGTAPVAD